MSDAVPSNAPQQEQTEYMKFMSGLWEEVLEGPGEPDFAPGGYDRRILGFDLVNNRLTLLQSHGSVIIPAEFAIKLLDDDILIQSSEEGPSRFDSIDQATMKAMGVQFEEASRALPLRLSISLNTNQIILEGAHYRRADWDDFAEMRGDLNNEVSQSNLNKTIENPGMRQSDDSEESMPVVDFFGTRATGRYFCFVVDVSGSMSGQKLESLKQELTKAVRSLSPGARFQVVFFSDGAEVLRRKWYASSPRDIQRFEQGLEQIRALGGTNAGPALTYAFEDLDPQPDILFLLTDGQIEADAPDLIDRLNSGAGKTQVNTIAFGGDAVTEPLQEIARRNGGSYTAVP